MDCIGKQPVEPLASLGLGRAAAQQRPLALWFRAGCFPRGAALRRHEVSRLGRASGTRQAARCATRRFHASQGDTSVGAFPPHSAQVVSYAVNHARGLISPWRSVATSENHPAAS